MFADRYRGVFQIGPLNGDGDVTHTVGKADGAAIVDSVELFNTASAATHATNYVTYSLINLGTDATGTTVIASASTSQTGGTAFPDFEPFVLAVTESAATLADGEVLGLVRAEENTDAVAQSNLVCIVRYTQIGPPND